MGDSAASVVGSEETGRMEATSTHTVTKNSVTSFEASSMKTSHESAVRLESLLEGGVVEGAGQQILQLGSQSHAAQTCSQTQSIQSSSQSQIIESSSQSQSVQSSNQSQSIQSLSQSQATQSFSQSQVSESATQPAALVDTAGSETPAVDENANIQQQQEEPPAQTHSEVQPQPVEETEPATETALVVEPGPEPVADHVVESKPSVEPEVISVEPESIANTEPVEEPTVEKETVVQPESVIEPEPVVEPEEVEPQTTVESTPIVESEPAVEPEPAVELETAVEAATVVEETKVVESEPEVVAGGGTGEEISQENIRTQLHEIITEIEQTVLPEQQQQQQQQPLEEEVQGHQEGGAGKEQPVVEVKEGEALEEVQYYDEDGVLHHTWQPRGKYQIQHTPIMYEDIVPISVPEVQFTEIEVPKPEPPKPEPRPEPTPKVPVKVDLAAAMTNGGLSPTALSPIEIPEGIPLLARILPKDEAREGLDKISLERLFTPATDSGDLTPKKKKAFASSSFYRPDHPTIDDQVELAQRISFSLVDANNKMSRGQSMYMKRKKRSMRWIHEGCEGDEEYTGSGTEGQEEDSPPQAPTKPAMKLLMNPKGVQDFQAVQQHYQVLMDSAVPTSPEVGKIVAEVQSPTGKGAELFAKRKKRMDKFIVDETTVQKAQQQTTMVMQQTLSSSSSASTSSSTFTAKKQAEMERNKQQDQILLANTVCDRADSKAAAWIEMPKAVPLDAPTINPAPSGPVDFYTAEVKVVQRASLPPTPVAEITPHSLLDFAIDTKEDKRRSASFNMAAKGWGTYNNFYTPVTFATSS